MQDVYKNLERGGEKCMGLDMYLNRRIYVWSDQRGSLTITGVKSKIRPDKVKFIIEEAGYWRKANAIHMWFVKNVQDGNDNCKEYYVSKEDMQKLLDTVNKVLKASELVDGEINNGYTYNKDGKREPIVEKGKYIKDQTVAKALLPTTEGFFFGSTDYDQYYYQDLVNTKKILEDTLKENEGDYEYSSSW
jgi:hypothetical protein